MFLARKISRAKWEVERELSEGEIPADAIRVDLHTKDNKLSFWRCGSETEVEDAALAIAATRDNVDKLDIVWVDEGELKTDDQTLKDTKGETPVTELAERHVDVCQLDYVRLGKVAHRVMAAIKKEQCIRLTKKQVTDILVAAVEQKRVDLNDLRPSLRKKILTSLQAEQ